MPLETGRESLADCLADVKERVGAAQDVLAIDLVQAVVRAVISGRTSGIVEVIYYLLSGVRAAPGNVKSDFRTLLLNLFENVSSGSLTRRLSSQGPRALRAGPKIRLKPDVRRPASPKQTKTRLLG